MVCDGGNRTCQICDSTQKFNLVVDYRYRHAWYLFGFVTKRDYRFICCCCHNGFVAQKTDYRGKLGKDPIPFMRRRGGLVACVLLVALIAFAVFEGASHDKVSVSLLAAPQIGDIYFADLSKITHGYENSPVFGAMKLVAINGSHERFIIAKSGYGKKKRLRSDVRTEVVRADSYYDTNDVVELSPEKIVELNAVGVIYDVMR